MSKAIVVGGSNGIGLALANTFAKEGKEVIILDRCEPSIAINNCKFIKTDLCDFDIGLFNELSQDKDIDTLFITAGFGRICNFESLSTTEIEKLFKVNSVAITKIIRAFYERIKSNDNFYAGVMGSIAGLVSSPMFSVYSATKAAICKLTEAINVELEANGFKNRVLCVNPGSIKGTKFNGGNNDLSLTEALADEIKEKLFARETSFIPDYEATYRSVIERYNDNSHKFGLESYEYKKQSGRTNDKSPIIIGYLSGTFDLFHIGHLNLIRRAKAECDYLMVGVHRDASHKGKETFIPYEERLAIVGACKYVDKVVEACKEDDEAWKIHRYDKLFVGSDYKGTERFLKYERFFEDKGVEIVYFPYTQSTSSTQIRTKITEGK